MQRLRNAIQEYENDRWRVISHKMGFGFSVAACKEKAAKLGAEDRAREEPATQDFHDRQRFPDTYHSPASSEEIEIRSSSKGHDIVRRSPFRPGHRRA